MMNPGIMTVLGALLAVGGLHFDLEPLFAAGFSIVCIGGITCLARGITRDESPSKFVKFWFAGAIIIACSSALLDPDGLWSWVIFWIGFAFFVIGTIGLIYDEIIHSPFSDDPPPPYV